MFSIAKDDTENHGKGKNEGGASRTEQREGTKSGKK